MAGKQVATDNQVILALKDNGGNRTAAAKALGIGERALYRRLQIMRDRGIEIPSTVTPSIYPATEPPPGTALSTLTRNIDDETGEVVLQWTKTKFKNEDRDAAIREAYGALLDDLPRVKARARVKSVVAAQQDDLLNLHILTDYHLGMLAWHEETGADWDVKIAERLLIETIRYGIEHSPPAKVGILGQLGDFLHYDSLESVTPRAGNILDADTRPEKMVRVAYRSLRYAIDMMLDRYEHVHVIMAEGNHDPMGSVHMRSAFAEMYRDNDRVSIDNSPDPYYAYQWGQVALFFHHGHLKKVGNISDVFVRKFREIYGVTRFAEIHMGHYHNEQKAENNLAKVHQWPTMAAADAYAARGGWLSDRMTPVLTYHQEHGRIGQLDISPGLLRLE